MTIIDKICKKNPPWDKLLLRVNNKDSRIMFMDQK